MSTFNGITPSHKATVVAKAAESTLNFKNGWEQTQIGELVAGGGVTIRYDVARLLHLRHSEATHWGIEAFIKFLPSGAISRGPVRDAPFVASIPLGATGAEVWFKSWAGGEGERKESFDSKHSANYQFVVKPRSAV